MLNRTHLCFLDCSTLFGHGLGVGSHTLCLWLGSRCLLGLGLGCSRGSSITLCLGLSLGLCLWLGRGLLGSSFLGCWLLCLGGCCLLGGLQTTNGYVSADWCSDREQQDNLRGRKSKRQRAGGKVDEKVKAFVAYRLLLWGLLQNLAKLVSVLASWLDQLASLGEVSQLQLKDRLPVA